MITVDAHTIVEVGKMYIVTCATIEAHDKLHFIPVIGEPHRDPELNVCAKHYHIDGRFSNDLYNLNNGRTNKVLLINHNDPCLKEDVRGYHTFKGITKQIKKCQRTETGIITPIFDNSNHWYWKWYQKYIGRKCNKALCPHLGVPMHERNGYLVCPLHGLVADPATEKIILPYELDGDSLDYKNVLL